MIPTISVRLNGQRVALPVPHSLIIRLPVPLLANNASTEPTSDEDDNETPDDEDFMDRVERTIADAEDDSEDAPDWDFEEGETRSKDPEYIFCPAAHRKQLLKLFTSHFCRHPLLPEPTGIRSASEIYADACHEMYSFCHQRGLADVWAYMWNSWYSNQMWKLWALSACPRIPRLRTTMNAENLWKQLKHDFFAPSPPPAA